MLLISFNILEIIHCDLPVRDDDHVVMETVLCDHGRVTLGHEVSQTEHLGDNTTGSGDDWWSSLDCVR